MAELEFDASTVDPSPAFSVIPAGKYVAMITKSEIKGNKSGVGEHMEFVFQVIGSGPDVPPSEEYNGRLLWARLNLFHPNATTVEIARKELSAICRSVGVMKLAETAQFHNLPLVIKVACKKRDDNGEIGNEITGYEARPVAPGQPNQQPSNTSPWKR